MLITVFIPASPRPLACPSLQSIRFCSEVFHPSVDPESWELDLSGKWSLWRSPWDEGALDSPSCDWVWHLLKHLRKTFLKIEFKVRDRHLTHAFGVHRSALGRLARADERQPVLSRVISGTAATL